MQTIHLSLASIQLPDTPTFPKQVEALREACYEIKKLQKRPSPQADADRFRHCHTLIEGLYQVWACQSPKARLKVLLSPQFYNATEFGKINHLSYYFLDEAVDALEHLGWAVIAKGKKTKTENIPTQLVASGELLQAFEQASVVWTPLKPPPEVVVLRGYDQKNKERYPIKVPKTSQVRKMEANLRRINDHLRQQAICLHMSNGNLKNLRVTMAEGRYRSQWHLYREEKHGRLLNFNHVCLRRIFSQGSMERGGRFYGAWWQFIPSEYRPYLTINGLATVEVDFSELHPRLLYISQGLEPPTGDLYDIGLRQDGQPYDASQEPYASQRKIIKEVFNALLNDETGGYRPTRSKLQTLGISYAKLKKLLIKRHPPLATAIGQGVGLDFQFLDSKIAERVMLKLLVMDITCLPVHDSFVVPRHQTKELISAMDEAFAEELSGSTAKLKQPAGFKSDFRLAFKGEEVDLAAIMAVSRASEHDRYVQSRYEAAGQQRQPRRGARPTMPI